MVLLVTFRDVISRIQLAFGFGSGVGGKGVERGCSDIGAMVNNFEMKHILIMPLEKYQLRENKSKY